MICPKDARQPSHPTRAARRFTIAEICSLGVALVTALISHTGSWHSLSYLRYAS